MDAPRIAVRVAALSAVGLLVVLLFTTAGQRGAAAFTPVTDKAGLPMTVPTAPGRTLALWNDLPVTVYVVNRSELDGVDAVRGRGSATPSIDVPAGLRLFVLSAKSTHLGCTVGFNAGLGASLDVPDYDGDGLNDGRILDPCGQGQWDAFHRGEHVAGPGERRLPSLVVQVRNGALYGSGYDGPVGPPART
jgi:Rieske Fe-S protein